MTNEVVRFCEGIMKSVYNDVFTFFEFILNPPKLF